MLPGCFDGLVARMCARQGFAALYLSGGGVSALSGVPDVGLRSEADFSAKIRALADTSGLPVLSDADTGFADPAHTVRAFVGAGAAGLHIEDQVFPKRCGHVRGKQVVPAEDFERTLQRCVSAAGASPDPAFIICARSDARGVDGGSVDETVVRLQRYADAGADMLFPEGLRSEEELATVAEALKASHGTSHTGGPFMLCNMTEFGVTPHMTAAELGEIGYDLTIFPLGLFRLAMRAVESGIAELQQEGSFAGKEGEMLTRSELYDRLKYAPTVEEPWEYPSPEWSEEEE
jgi:methylisocitrate lyase